MRGFSTQWSGNKEFKSDLSLFLLKPLIKEPLFELNRCIGVWSREGNFVADVVVRFCKENGIPVSDPPQKVEFGNTRAIYDFLVSFKESSVPCAEGERYVLVIDSADILAYEPDSEEVMRFFMRIKDYAVSLNIQIVFCFERPPNWVEQGSMQKTFRYYLGTQISAVTFMPAPDITTRDLIFRECVAHYGGGEDLTDADFIFLASHSQFATYKQIVEFFKRCVAHERYPEKLDFEMFRSRMQEPRHGEPHILGIDVCAVEDKMSLACGKGPQQLAVKTNANGTDDHEARLRAMTKMTTKNVSFAAAKEELKRMRPPEEEKDEDLFAPDTKEAKKE